MFTQEIDHSIISPTQLLIIEIITALLIMLTLWMIFVYAPMEQIMGAVQKVFYIHVASLWVGMLGFLIAAFTSLRYLQSTKIHYDLMSIAAIEISLVFFLLGIISGSIWAKPIWNTWWTWDPRLTSAAIVELVYCAYFILRQSIEMPEQRARFSAVYAILGFISVPLTFLSIRFLRTIHPVVIGTNEQGFVSIAPSMLHTLLVTIIAFSLLFIILFWKRIRLGEAALQLETIKEKLYE